MSQNDLTWTNRKKEDADAALVAVVDMVSKYGMQLILEAMIHHNGLTIGMTGLFGAETDYLVSLEDNLKKTLEEYKDRHDEFGKK